MERKRITETVVVEGRDDEAAVRRAVLADVISTHGYGISEDTLKRVRKAYEARGIIIFTDPDHAGRAIRKKLTKLFPEALEAYLTTEEATLKEDIGVENAKPENIARALAAAGGSFVKAPNTFYTDADMAALGLSGFEGSAKLRNMTGEILGIGGGNAAAFLKRLNITGVQRKDLEEAVKAARENLSKVAPK